MINISTQKVGVKVTLLGTYSRCQIQPKHDSLNHNKVIKIKLLSQRLGRSDYILTQMWGRNVESHQVILPHVYMARLLDVGNAS